MNLFTRRVPISRIAVRVVLGLSGGTTLLLRSHETVAPSLEQMIVRLSISPDLKAITERRVLSQVSAGSLAGLGMGLAAVYFSRVLTIVVSVIAAIVWTAWKYDISENRMLKVGNMARVSGDGEKGMLYKCNENKPFSLAFAVVFALAVFGQF